MSETPLLITSGVPVKKPIPHEVVFRANGKFRLSDNPQIYQPICEWVAAGLPTKDIIVRIKEEWDIDLSAGTLDALHHTPRYARLIAQYRKNIGPLLRKIPGVHKLQRVRVLSNIMMDDGEDARTRIIAAHELEVQTSDEKTSAMIAQAESSEVPEHIKEQKIIETAIKLMDKKDINTCLCKDLEERIISTAYKIQKTRDMYSGKMINAKVAP